MEISPFQGCKSHEFSLYRPIAIRYRANSISGSNVTKQIDPRQASVAATFYEPVYQRLRQLHASRPINLLCFIHETNDTVRDLMAEWGAKKSTYFRAKCFSEIWELPDDERALAIFDGEPSMMDDQISKAMGCLDGEYTAATGNLLWGDRRYGSPRRHFASRILIESQGKGRSA